MDFDPAQIHILHEWKHGKPMIVCRFDPTGRYLFSSSEDYTIQRWSMDSGEKVDWPAHESWVRDFTFLPDGETLISAGSDDRIIFWPATADSPAPIREVIAHDGWVRCVDVSPDGAYVASGGNDNLVKLWTADGQLIREFSGHDRNVYSIYFHPSGEFLLSGDLHGVVNQWNVQTGEKVRTIEAKDLHSYNGGQQVDFGGIRHIDLNHDGTLLACCGVHKATNPFGAVSEPLIVLLDLEKGEKVRAQPAEGIKGIGWEVEFLLDDVEVLSSGGTGGGFLLFFKPGEEKPFHQLKFPNTVRSMSVHPDGLHIATTHHDGHVRISRMAKKAEG